MKRSSRKEAESPRDAIRNPFTRASEIFSENVECFQNACEIYKQVLDRNLLDTFCGNEHCEMVYTIEVKYGGSRWGATPKIFYDKEEAKKEAEAFKVKYPFVSEWRIVTRRMAEKLIREEA